MYVGENESVKSWLSIMNGLKNQGVEDILIACVDDLNGFPQAIEAHLQLFTNLISVFNVYTKLETVSLTHLHRLAIRFLPFEYIL